MCWARSVGMAAFPSRVAKPSRQRAVRFVWPRRDRNGRERFVTLGDPESVNLTGHFHQEGEFLGRLVGPQWIFALAAAARAAHNPSRRILMSRYRRDPAPRSTGAPRPGWGWLRPGPLGSIPAKPPAPESATCQARPQLSP